MKNQTKYITEMENNLIADSKLLTFMTLRKSVIRATMLNSVDALCSFTHKTFKRFSASFAHDTVKHAQLNALTLFF